MGRPPIAERVGETRRGPWTPEEDITLVSYIQECGPNNWRFVPNNAGLQRCGKSCRLRWKNYLRPGIKRGNFTPEEDMIIIRQQALLGNRWATIAAHLPSRTDNDIKNYWHTHLKKKLGKVVDSSGTVESAKKHEDYNHKNGDAATAGGLDYIKAYYDKIHKDAMAGNSITTTPQNNQEKKSVYDDNDIEIPSLTSIEKWLLEDPSAPLPAVPAAPVPQDPPAPAPTPAHAPSTAAGNEGPNHLLNMFTPFGHAQFSFGPFY